MGAQLPEEPLFAGFYSFRDAARLLKMSSPRKLKGWILGWKGGAEPIVKGDYSDDATVSFLDLMELRFVEHFRRQNVPLQTLRKAAQRARQEWGATHPFALSDLHYLTDRKNVFAQVAKDTDDRITWNLVSGQHEIWEVLEHLVSRGVAFSPDTHLATSWKPLADTPRIIIDPQLAFGRPSIEGRGVPTRVLFEHFMAGESKQSLATWFDVEPEDVAEAIKFELSLAH